MENELERLIAEQARDDTTYVRREQGVLFSLDAVLFPGDRRPRTHADEFGQTMSGALVTPSWRGRSFRRPRSYESIPHGTTNGYANCDCRCDKCRAAWAAYKREYTKRRSGRDKPRTCPSCDGPYFPRRVTQVYCSKRCKSRAYDRRNVERRRLYDRNRTRAGRPKSSKKGLEVSVA